MSDEANESVVQAWTGLCPGPFSTFSLNEGETSAGRSSEVWATQSDFRPSNAHSSTVLDANMPVWKSTSVLQDEVDADNIRPPTRPRKRKAPTLREVDWEPHKARIIELHITQNSPLPLKEVKDIIARETGFNAEYALLEHVMEFNRS